MRKRIKIVVAFDIDTDHILSLDGIEKGGDDSPSYIQAQDCIYAMTSDFVRNLESGDSSTSIEVTVWN